MAIVTLRGISTELSRALRHRASANKRSVEAEIKAILEQAALPQSRVRIGTELAALGQDFGGVDLDTRRASEPARSAALE